jgi:plasmid stability protein
VPGAAASPAISLHPIHEKWLLFHESQDTLIRQDRQRRSSNGRRYEVATLQVKGIDDRLYKALGARAAMDNRSVSQEVVTIIQEFLSKPRQEPREATRAFLDLAGSWSDIRTPKEIVADIRKARRAKRRFRRADRVFA